MEGGRGMGGEETSGLHSWPTHLEDKLLIKWHNSNNARASLHRTAGLKGGGVSCGLKSCDRAVPTHHVKRVSLFLRHSHCIKVCASIKTNTHVAIGVVGGPGVETGLRSGLGEEEAAMI